MCIFLLSTAPAAASTSHFGGFFIIFYFIYYYIYYYIWMLFHLLKYWIYIMKYCMPKTVTQSVYYTQSHDTTQKTLIPGKGN